VQWRAGHEREANCLLLRDAPSAARACLLLVLLPPDPAQPSPAQPSPAQPSPSPPRPPPPRSLPLLLLPCSTFRSTPPGRVPDEPTPCPSPLLVPSPPDLSSPRLSLWPPPPQPICQNEKRMHANNAQTTRHARACGHTRANTKRWSAGGGGVVVEYVVLTKRRGGSEDREDGLVTYVHTHKGRDTHTHKGKQLRLSERRWKARHMHIQGRTCVRVRCVCFFFVSRARAAAGTAATKPPQS
jgi:hypothetical protein